MNKKWEDPKSKYFHDRIGEFDYRAKNYFPKEKIPSDYLRKEYSQMSQDNQLQIVNSKLNENLNVNMNMNMNFKVNKNLIEMNQRESIINFAKGVMAVDMLNKFSW